MDFMFEALIFWLNERPQIIWSVFIPFVFCLIFMIGTFFTGEHRNWRQYVGALIIATAVGFEFSWWKVTEDMIQLHGFQISIFMIAYLMVLDIDISPGMAYALTFFSDLMVDFFQARWFHPFFSTDFDTSVIIKIIGIGGAGIGDGLFIYPLIAAIIAYYNRRKIRETLA